MYDKYKEESNDRIKKLKNNKRVDVCWSELHQIMASEKYTYNFFWLGFPILQLPQDMQALQEIIFDAKPEVIIETGVAYGGSLMFSASMLAILEACGYIKNGLTIGIEINLYPENRKAIQEHPLYKKIKIIDGSSIDSKIVREIATITKGKRVLVCLDSNHTHDHVLAELRAYAPLVNVGSYIMVGDTGVEDLTETSDRPWGKGNNPQTAVWQFLLENKDFEICDIHSKLILTGSPNGYLKRIK